MKPSSTARWCRWTKTASHPQYVAKLWLCGRAPALLHIRCADSEGQGCNGRSVDEAARTYRRAYSSEASGTYSLSPILDATLRALIQSVKAQGLEGLVAKRRDSSYEPGQRSGAWQKNGSPSRAGACHRGLRPRQRTFDALVIGYYEGDRLMYAARTRNGFTPASRAELFRKIKPLEIKECPFANLPEKRAGRWGAGLTATKMAECRWLKPQLVGQFEFVQWTEDGHLRHSRFVAFREDKKAKEVRRE